MTLCAEPHPEQDSVLCDKPAPCWVYHANAPQRLVWPGIPLPPTEAAPDGKGSVKGQLAMMASRAR